MNNKQKIDVNLNVNWFTSNDGFLENNTELTINGVNYNVDNNPQAIIHKLLEHLNYIPNVTYSDNY